MATNLQVEKAVNSAAQSVKDQNGNTSPLTLATDKVGIGTTNPQGKLDVGGNIVRERERQNPTFRSQRFHCS